MMSETRGADRPGAERIDFAVVVLAAFCALWVLVGSWIEPAMIPAEILSPQHSPQQHTVATWLLAICPVAFWLGGRLAATRRAVLPLTLSLMALLLAAGPWSVHPNDLAALLAVLVPWWLVLALEPAALPRRLALAALGVACASALWSTGSRGGVLASVVGLVAGLVFAGGNRRRLLLAPVLVAVLLPTLWLASRGTPLQAAARGWILDHDAEGVTWEHLSTGRPVLWRQAWRVIGDVPLFGAGVGSYGILVPKVYPPPLQRIDLPPNPAHVPDAHQLYLETAVAFGVPTMLAFLALCSIGLWRLAKGALRAEAVSAAAFGGLLAYLVHGLGDCAAPGGVVYVAGWMVLGFACRPRSFRITWATGSATVAILLLSTFAVVRLLPAERWHRRAARAVLDADATAAEELRRSLDSGDSCREAWWRERLAVVSASPSAEFAVRVARCAPHRLPDVIVLSPFDATRAAAVHALRPHNPDALLWHLWNTPGGPGLVSGYFQYFALRPEDAPVRMEFLRRLGTSWTQEHPGLAMAFLAQACAHGDPGANACYGAGNLARRLDLGDAVADSFYLASQWPGARRLATTGDD